jgi:hypothetical protein
VLIKVSGRSVASGLEIGIRDSETLLICRARFLSQCVGLGDFLLLIRMQAGIGVVAQFDRLGVIGSETFDAR